jgi:hypothetical protein
MAGDVAQCSRCRFWIWISAGPPVLGQCLRLPPVPVWNPSLAPPAVQSCFPVLRDVDRCFMWTPNGTFDPS